jgi:hypothetical protein
MFGRVREHKLEPWEVYRSSKMPHCVSIHHTMHTFGEIFPHLAHLLSNLGYLPPSWFGIKNGFGDPFDVIQLHCSLGHPSVVSVELLSRKTTTGRQ